MKMVYKVSLCSSCHMGNGSGQISRSSHLTIFQDHRLPFGTVVAFQRKQSTRPHHPEFFPQSCIHFLRAYLRPFFNLFSSICVFSLPSLYQNPLLTQPCAVLQFHSLALPHSSNHPLLSSVLLLSVTPSSPQAHSRPSKPTISIPPPISNPRPFHSLTIP